MAEHRFVAEFRNLSRKPYRHTPSTPFTRQLFESTGNCVVAEATLSIFEIPFAELIPVAFDQQLTATRTPPGAP
jgi:hypothetical protein